MMWCLVSLPNSVVLEIELDPKALGQDCLNKVCKHIGVVETDFFGLLQVQSNLKDEGGYWLNVRNVLMRQVTGSPPYRLQLRVKFYVKPHYMLQSSTRSIVLKSLKPCIKDRSLKCNEEELIIFTALLAQSEMGDFKRAMLPIFKESYTEYLPAELCTEEVFSSIISEHKKHKGISQESAVYKALQVAASWEGYGMEWHSVRTAHTAVPKSIGVGPESIVLIDQQTDERISIEYGAVQKATHAGKCFYLHTLGDDGAVETEPFKLQTQKASNALYRCVTEMYLFYYCDTVRNDVASQFDRDIKGTLAALFSENKELGKKYVFDIQRTLQEAYDFNRRRLYAQENMPPANPAERSRVDGTDIGCITEELCSDGEASFSDEEAGEFDCFSDTCKHEDKSCELLSDMLLCKVCMDASINTVFCPCGHLTCDQCAHKLDTCPLCRQHITNLQPIYLPLLGSKSINDVQA